MCRSELRFNPVAGITEPAARELVNELAALAYDRPEGNSRGETWDAGSLIKIDETKEQALTAWRVDLEGGYAVVIGLVRTIPEKGVN